MAEPPAKRARRVDSSTMWDMSDRKTRSPEPELGATRSPRRDPYPRDEIRRDDRRYRSRSRDRRDRRRDRSRSRDRRDRDRDRDRDRGNRDRDGRGMRDRERSLSRERYHERRGPPPSKAGRYRDRSRSPIRNGNRDESRTPPPRGLRGDRRGDRRDNRAQKQEMLDSKPDGRSRDSMEMDVDDTGEDDIDAMMRRSMGFTRFRTTKNIKVPGNDVYGVRKEKKTEYRQYMNRVGGFNRPLSPSRQ